MTSFDNDAKVTEPALISHPLISRTNVFVLFGILAGLMIVGSFFDLKISQAIFNPENVFGIFFAAYGEWPATLALLIAGVLLIVFRNRERRAVGTGQLIGGGVLLILGAGATLFMPTMYLDLNPFIVAGIGVLAVALVVYILLDLSRGADREVAIKVATVLLTVVIVEMILINLLKIGWERPRMRMLEEQPSALFDAWWVFGHEAKAGLLDAGVKTEEFKSFPSGHTSNSAALILLTVLIPLRNSLRKYAPLLFWIGAIWGLLVAFSRVIAGAHFVTDTVVGFTVTLVVILVAYRVVFPVAKQPNYVES